MYKKQLLQGMLLYALTLPVYAGVVVSINSGYPQIGLGEIVDFNVDIIGLDSSLALGSYDLSVGFDPVLLHFNNVVFGDPLLGDQLDLAKQGQNFPSVTADAGSVNLIEFSLDNSTDLFGQQASDFTLATLYFTALTSGTSPLNLSLHSLADSEANLIVADSQNTSVAITGAVPLPATLWLFISGLGLLLRRQLTLHS